MIRKLPRWVEVGGFFLTLLAGSVNAIALLGFNHQGVSHLTGSSTQLGVELADGNLPQVMHLLIILASFVVGAALSGLAIGNESLKLGRRYSATLLAEAAILLLAMYFLNRGSNLGHYLASGACGLQNAMTSTFSGAVVRTSHVTGLFTDLGITFGLRLRGQAIDRRRVVLYLTLITGFILGGVLGAFWFGSYRFNAMLAPAGIAALMAITHLLYWRRVRAMG
ncbi:YoaK family protein [Uliginosibacterium sp. H3]|uniref:YoaK family protein n=1 Tax=Uliginosibacterium silvisoli TaxID=3114758 RepID=A0ABU6K7H3_9RHOO|nr:YoaK family protein [Uliginosibacterium sp. H3]